MYCNLTTDLAHRYFYVFKEHFTQFPKNDMVTNTDTCALHVYLFALLSFCLFDVWERLLSGSGNLVRPVVHSFSHISSVNSKHLSLY
jgi:hypothetical protein